MPEAEVQVTEVKAFKTQSGNTRFVLVDDEGREYTTFREEIARAAVAAEGHRARITFHEEQRGRFTNVYLDSVEVVDADAASAEDDDSREPIEANKGTAVRSLLEERGLHRALYAGDDTTDLDAFAAVGELELGVRVAVASAEGPASLRDAADVVVASPAALVELLRTL